jgi:hypothetical protein
MFVSPSSVPSQWIGTVRIVGESIGAPIGQTSQLLWTSGVPQCGKMPSTNKRMDALD